MKNKAPIIIVAVLLLIGAAVFFITRSNKTPDGMMTGTQKTGGNSPFTSIQDALSKSVSLQCSFTDEAGRQTETYIKNGAVRTNFTAATPEDSGSMIMKDKRIHLWNAKNEGMTIEIPDVTPPPGQPGTTGEQSASWDDTMAALEKYKESCKTAVVADSLFTPPSTVKFTDYSQLQNQMMQPAPTGSTGTSGSTTQQGYSEEDVKKMMQQYQSEPNSGN